MAEAKVEREVQKQRPFLIKWIRRLFGATFFLLLLIILLLQFSVVQTWLSSRFTKYISEATNTIVTAERLKISPFDGIILQNIDIKDKQYNSIVHGGAINVSLRRNIFFLLNNKLDLSYIGIKDVKLNIVTEFGESKSNLQKFIDNLSSSPNQNSKGKPIDFQLKEVDLSDIYIKTDNKNNGKYEILTLAGGNIDINYLDLECREFDINTILLDQPTYLSFIYEYSCNITDELSIPVSNVPKVNTDSEPMTLTFRELVVKDGKFGKSNALIVSESQYKDYLDFDNFYFEKINLLLKNFSFRNNNEIFSTLETLSAVDNTGFEIKNVKCDSILITSTSAEMRSLLLEMGNTSIKDQLKLSFADFDSFSKFTDKVVLDISFMESKIYMQDLVHFVKSLSKIPAITNNLKEYIDINGRFYGKINNLAGRDVDIRIGQKLNLAGSFNTRDLLDPDNTVLNIKLERFNTSMQKLKMILPSFNAPENFNKLGSIHFTGRFDGYLEDFVAYGKLKSDVGTAELDMRLDVTQGSNKANYSGTLNLQNFNLGKWADNADLGLVNFKSKVGDGRGLT